MRSNLTVKHGANLAGLTMDSMEFTDALEHAMKHTAELPPMQVDALIVHLGRVARLIDGHVRTLELLQACQRLANHQATNQPKPTTNQQPT